jgi:XTP/dITP diphosphohydrolase
VTQVGDRLRLVCASANPDKVAEIAAILGDAVALVPRPADVPDVVEDADTLEGNARLKAVAICEASGQAAVADDTGLEVFALGGAPGVYAARFAGEDCSYADNQHKLLRELGDATDRRAQFRTVALVRWPDGSELVVDGICTGTISDCERGARGFGYDAVFVPDEGDGRTFAEMSEAEKNAVSHRGRAFRNLLAALEHQVPGSKLLPTEPGTQ